MVIVGQPARPVVALAAAAMARGHTSVHGCSVSTCVQWACGGRRPMSPQVQHTHSDARRGNGGDRPRLADRLAPADGSDAVWVRATRRMPATRARPAASMTMRAIAACPSAPVRPTTSGPSSAGSTRSGPSSTAGLATPVWTCPGTAADAPLAVAPCMANSAAAANGRRIRRRQGTVSRYPALVPCALRPRTAQPRPAQPRPAQPRCLVTCGRAAPMDRRHM